MAKLVKKNKRTMKETVTKWVSDDASTIRDYAVDEVIMPAVLKTVRRLLHGSIDIIFGSGDEKERKSRDRDKPSYVKYSQSDRDYYPRRTRARVRRFDFDEISYDTEREARYVLDEMRSILDEGYEFVKVSEYYEISGLDKYPHTYEKWCWRSLRHARVVVDRDSNPDDPSYLLELPRPQPVD